MGELEKQVSDGAAFLEALHQDRWGDWIPVTDRMPEQGQKVWYYGEKPHFDMVFFERGEYEKEGRIHYFFGDRGVLSNIGASRDVMFWQPDTGQDRPEPPKVKINYPKPVEIQDGIAVFKFKKEDE